MDNSIFNPSSFKTHNIDPDHVKSEKITSATIIENGVKSTVRGVFDNGVLYIIEAKIEAEKVLLRNKN
ncbi:hypothetical protein [Roseivirga seohaensis]|uniref:hypothetical protein n=1 Tax=Roseivirga seohaensis TaxID=1914963 RepID=UPI003BAB396C